MAGKLPEGTNLQSNTLTFQKIDNVKKKHGQSSHHKPLPIEGMSAVIRQSGETQSSNIAGKRSLKKTTSHERLPLALVQKKITPDASNPVSPRGADREMSVDGMKSPRRFSQIGSAEAFPLKHSGRNAINSNKDEAANFKEKVHKKRGKLGAKSEKKHGWVAHLIRRVKKDNTLTSSLQVFNFSTWISELGECEKKSLNEEFRKYDLSKPRNSDDFIRLIYDISKQVKSQVIENILFKEPISYLTQLRDSYETDSGDYEESMPAELEDLCNSRSIKELIDGLAKIAPSENKTMMLWCIGGEQTLNTLQAWVEDKHSDEMKLKVFSILQKMEIESFREETLVKPRVIQMRKRAATSLPVRSIRPKELENISQRRQDVEALMEPAVAKELSRSEMVLEKGSELLISQGSLFLVERKLAKTAKGDSEEEEEECELGDGTAEFKECEEKPSSSKIEESIPKKKKTRRIFGVVSNLFHAVAKSENSKRFTIDTLKTIDVSCWTHSLEHCESDTIRDVIFQEQNKNLQVIEDVTFFIKWVDSITERVVENVISGNYLLSSPRYFLNQLLECHKEHENIPPVGLASLCAASSLKEFMEILNALDPGEDKDMIVWSIGGDPVISIMEKWLKNEHIDGIRLKVLNYLNDIADIRKTFATDALLFPKEMQIPQLSNEQAVRNWFPAPACNVDRLYMNSREVSFQRMPKPRVPYEKMEEEEILVLNRLEMQFRKSNLNILLQNLLQDNEKDFSKEVDELLDRKMSAATCKHKVLLLQGIEFSQPIVDVLFAYFKSLKSGFICRKGSGQFICRYQRIDGRTRVSIEKQYDIHNNGLIVGSFKLYWKCLVKGPRLVAIEECKVKGLKLDVCEPFSSKTRS